MEPIPDSAERRDVYCHFCGLKTNRSTFDGLLAPCSRCSSTDVHVDPPIGAPTIKRRRRSLVLI